MRLISYLRGVQTLNLKKVFAAGSVRKNNKIGFTDDGNIKTFGVPLGKIAARVKTNKKDSVLVKQHLSNIMH